MIYYSINTALSSKKIDKVVVSCSSDLIYTIGKQMGAEVVKREEEFVELKKVLKQVINDECDYIVIMFPTSPTLPVSVLDEAIEYTIDNDLQCVVSVKEISPYVYSNDGNNATNPFIEKENLKPVYERTGSPFVNQKY